MARLPWLAGLTLIWVLVQGEATVGNVLGGVAAAAVVLAAAPTRLQPRDHRVHPLALARFVGAVLVSLVTSSATVLRTVITPSPARLRAGIVRCELPGASPLVATMVANAITLTPGTLTLTADATADPAVLHVHALGLGDPDDLRAEVATLHRQAAAAVTPRPVHPDIEANP